MDYSIWKDIYFTANTQSLSYYVTATRNGLDDEVIFYGKAYAMPNTNYVSINVSRICKDHLSNDLSSFVDGTYYAYDARRTFKIKNDSGTTIGMFDLIYNWSYDYTQTADTIINQTINGHYAYGQKIMTAGVDGVGGPINIISTCSASDYCGRYALIYQNAYGGWDSFLIEGKYLKKDTYKSFNTERKYNNQNQMQFGDLRYVNEISTSYELHTGWLTDAQAAILAKNLIPSTRVYLQDIDGGTIVPVVITDTDAEYKKYKDEKELVSYEINVAESQVKERR